jgi:hypothetical protein
VTTIKQLADDRRDRGESAPAPAGSQWGVCKGVYEVGRGNRSRLIARVLLASGLAVTAYLPAGMAAPAIDSTVQVSVVAGGGDSPQASARITGGGDESSIHAWLT